MPTDGAKTLPPGGRADGTPLQLQRNPPSTRQQQTVFLEPAEHPALARLDPSTAFLYTPHTITVLLAGLSLIAYHGSVFGGTPPTEPAPPGGRGGSAAVRGVWAAILVYLGYSVVQGPRTSMVRPHPAVWRLVHGVLVVYTLFLVWVLFQDVGDARRFLRHLSPSLGVEVSYRSYAASCALWDAARGAPNWRALRETLFDEFVLAHTLGWWGKALILRNTGLLWTVSVAFELMELTFRHMLPNFNECWWDSWVLDVAVCNFIGIQAGMWTVRYFDCRYEHYNWQGLSTLKTFTAKAKRSVQQLLPYSWDKFHWMTFSSPLRCLQCALLVAIFLAFELNVFFLKFALWVPPTNPLNTYRLLLWFACGLPAVREYYEFINAHGGSGAGGAAADGGGGGGSGLPRRINKLGTFAWLAIAITCLETMASIKFGRGLYTAPWPRHVLWAWGAAGALFVGGLAAWQASLWLHQRRQRQEVQSKKEA